MICLSGNDFRDAVGEILTPVLFVECLKFYKIKFAVQRATNILSSYPYKIIKQFGPLYYRNWNINDIIILSGHTIDKFDQLTYIIIRYPDLYNLIYLMDKFCKLRAFL